MFTYMWSTAQRGVTAHFPVIKYKHHSSDMDYDENIIN